MIGILLVTHGRLAEELRAAALTIQPGLERIVAVALEWSETGEDAREKIRRGLEQADEGDGAIILTDMFGGTPTNLTLPFLRKDRVEIVTGVNLPDGPEVRRRSRGADGRSPRSPTSPRTAASGRSTWPRTCSPRRRAPGDAGRRRKQLP